MAVLKCKMCGGNLDVQEGTTVCECEYCGSKQTIPTVDDEKKMKLFDRANRLRFNCEFDKAGGVYESIIEEFPEEAEGYWGNLLCKYGIEYVDDPVTGDKIPTCHRSSFESLMDDEDFEMVMENADSIARGVYREQAKQIEELRKGIVEISAKEQPYDIFICYKETDENGDRTLDSVLAQDVYDALIAKSYRVFFSRISLEDKLGVEYEPYIFAALNSAKVMLAFGTSYDNYNAVWVKNEWSRFLRLMAKDKTKYLIPCFKDIDAYDMPKEFTRLQAQDMGKVGALQDLVRGIDKILGKNEDSNKSAQEISQSAVMSGPGIEPLLKRAFMFLEDGNWDSADEYAEKVLDLDPENAEAYLAKLMAEMKVRRRADLSRGPVTMDQQTNYKKAMQFGNQEFRDELARYYSEIKKRSEDARLNVIYTDAFQRMTNARTETGFKKAARIFQSISEYKDAQARADQCLEKAVTIRDHAEKEKEEVHQKAQMVIEALKTQRNLSLEESLAAAKQRVTELITVFDNFDALQTEMSKPIAYIRLAEARISELTSKRASLGMFAGKEKRNIDEELKTHETEKQNAEVHLNNLKAKLHGYQTKAEIEKDLEAAKQVVAEWEDKIGQARSTGKFFYSKNEALDLLGRDPKVAAEVIRIGQKETLDPLTAAMLGITDQVSFGKYRQNKRDSRVDPIEWIVLARERSRLLLISKYALECRKYNETNVSTTWETSTLRTWLNSYFICTAFSADEQKMIQNVKVTAVRNPLYDTPPGKDTTDKVFLLSIPEAKKYFPSDEARMCVPTEYAKSQMIYTVSNACWWWLRSPGENTYCAANVDNISGVYERGSKVNNDYGAVRPAMWIDLKS